MRIAIACLLTVGLLASNCSGAPAPVVAEQPKLKVGDPAPKLIVDRWVKGEPVSELAKGTVYVMDFWGTWCAPCIEFIPHMSSVQKKYKDKNVVVIGVSIWETDPAAVEPFVKKMGSRMDYRVATDRVHPGGDPELGAMSVTWMKAFARTTVPFIAIVDRDGKLAWTGSPEFMDRPLAEVVAGTFNPTREAQHQAKRDALDLRYGEAMNKADYDRALSALNETIALDSDIVSIYRPAKLRVLLKKKDYRAANAWANEAAAVDENQDILVRLATMLLNETAASEQVDVNVAMKLADKAVRLGGERGKAARAVVAAAHAAKGDFAKAVEHQTAAMQGAEGDQREILQRDLDAYKARAAGKK